MLCRVVVLCYFVLCSFQCHFKLSYVFSFFYLQLLETVVINEGSTDLVLHLFSLFSFLLGILVIIGVHEVRQVSSSSRDLLETLRLPENCDGLNDRTACALMPYRTFDGRCNNLCNITRGAIFHPLQRLETLAEPTAYDGPGFKPRSRSVSGKPLPNARAVSRRVFESNSTQNINNSAPDFTHLTMTWGQFLDHDITLTEVEEAECGTNDEVCPIRPECISINILPGDELEVNPNFKCIPTPRSFRDRNGEQVS